MSLKTYDRTGQVWASLHASGALSTMLVTGTQGRVKKSKLIMYHVLVSQGDHVWLATIADNLRSRWESDPRLVRVV